MPTLKGRVNIPTEPTVIGQWDAESIRLSTIYDTNNGTLLSQDLFSATHNFFVTPSLLSICDLRTTPYNPETKLLVPKGKFGSPANNRRFIVDIGHHKHHEKNYANRPCLKKDGEIHESFTATLTTHYVWCFESNEMPYIQKALNHDNVIHVVVYNRFYKPIARSSQEVVPIYVIVAAASFLIADTSSTLLYIGVSSETFMKTDIYQSISTVSRKTKKKHETHLPIEYRQKSIGSFMLCMIQTIFYFVIGSHTIIAEVKNHASNGAVYFYLKHYFQIISRKNHQVYATKKIFGNAVFQNVSNLIYVMSRCAIYLVYPRFMWNLSSVEAMEDAIYHGAKLLLNLPDLRNNVIESTTLSLYQNCCYQMINNDEPYICSIDDSETDQLTKWQEKNNNSDDDILHPTFQFWERFLNQQSLDLIQVSRDHNPKKRHYFYKMMAIVLFDDEKRYPDIRCYFFFIFQCIGFMSITQCPLYDYEKRRSDHKDNDQILSFQMNILSAITLCEEIFGVNDIKSSNLLTTDLKPYEDSGMENFQNAIHYLSLKQLNPLYPCTELEMSLFSGIFNVDWKVFFGYSLKKQGLQKDMLSRKWFIKENIDNKLKKFCLIIYQKRD